MKKTEKKSNSKLVLIFKEWNNNLQSYVLDLYGKVIHNRHEGKINSFNDMRGMIISGKSNFPS